MFVSLDKFKLYEIQSAANYNRLKWPHKMRMKRRHIGYRHIVKKRRSIPFYRKIRANYLNRRISYYHTRSWLT